MLLNASQMKSVVRGAVRLEEKNGMYSFFRFTEEQEQAYASRRAERYYKTFSASGVRIALRTDSKHIGFRYRFGRGSSRRFSWFDIYENGTLISHFGGNGAEPESGCMELILHDGTNTVEIYFPWSRTVEISALELDDGAHLKGVFRKHRLLAFGDSITHGYDARYPSLSYVSRLARLLDADEVNKGIGGEMFFPELLQCAEPFLPDCITVAYGTNDWFFCSRDEVERNCRAFYTRLTALYPHARIYAITPICRLDADTKTAFGAPASAVDALIREMCADLPNVTVINGWHLTPAHPDFFSDSVLHPNDLGFGIYAENLYREIIRSQNT